MFLKLFLTFLEIGAVSFGGGYGTISLIRERKSCSTAGSPRPSS
ncbi:MAG: chromate transporter [Faecalibacterium prausnitzii]